MATQILITRVEDDPSGTIVGYRVLEDGEQTPYASSVKVPAGASRGQIMQAVRADADQFREVVERPKANIDVGDTFGIQPV
jgi:hypothetical protein